MCLWGVGVGYIYSKVYGLHEIRGKWKVCTQKGQKNRSQIKGTLC